MRNGVHKYVAIQGILRARLERDLAPGSKIPSEALLCEEFGVSRATIQQALKMLEDAGYIRREQGLGTFYLGTPVPRMQQRPSQVLESLIKGNDGAVTKLIYKNTRRPPPAVAALLDIPEDSTIVYLERVLLIDDDPIAFIRTYLPEELGRKILRDEEDLKRLSLATLLEDKYGISIDSVDQTITASLTEPSFAEYLGTEVGDPVLEGSRTYLDRSGHPLFCAITSYRADRHCFVVNLKDWR